MTLTVKSAHTAQVTTKLTTFHKVCQGKLLKLLTTPHNFIQHWAGLLHHVRRSNRDTAWYSVIDSEYPALRVAYEKWLAPISFDENGCQREKLSQLINEARARDSV